MPLTPTPRLALVNIDPNPVTGDFVDPAVLNANSAKIDGAIGAFPCTSATRPGAPFHGQLIRETDTGRVYVRNSTALTWDLVADPVAEYGSWATWAPVWTAGTANPVLNDGTLTGRQRTVGKTMDFQLKLTWGPATTAAGTGLWRFTLPAAVKAESLASLYIEDGSAGQRWIGVAKLFGAANGDNMRLIAQSGTGGISGASSPFVWATTDSLIMHATVELA